MLQIDIRQIAVSDHRDEIAQIPAYARTVAADSRRTSESSRA
jgi:hypothetical protein